VFDFVEEERDRPSDQRLQLDQKQRRGAAPLPHERLLAVDVEHWLADLRKVPPDCG
jgi:hypothetical protein